MIGLLKFWHVNFDSLPCLFFSARFLNMGKLWTTFCLLWGAGPPGLVFYGKGPADLLSCMWIMNAGWLGSMRSENFLQMTLFIFQGCPHKQNTFLAGQSYPYNQLIVNIVHFESFFLHCIMNKLNIYNNIIGGISGF